MKTMMWPKKKIMPDRGGFSLVEIMMVVLLMGILVGISAPPMFNYLQSNQMQTRSDRMVADLQYARAVAISTGQAHRFANTTTSYTLTNLVTGNVLKNVAFDNGSELNSAQAADFFPWGMATSTIYTLSLRGLSRQITILPTGMVEAEAL